MPQLEGWLQSTLEGAKAHAEAYARTLREEWSLIPGVEELALRQELEGLFGPHSLVLHARATEQVLALHQPVDEGGACRVCTGVESEWPCTTLKSVTAGWGMWPGYRPEWKPREWE